jgi:hypothetical protein
MGIISHAWPPLLKLFTRSSGKTKCVVQLYNVMTHANMMLVLSGSGFYDDVIPLPAGTYRVDANARAIYDLVLLVAFNFLAGGRHTYFRVICIIYVVAKIKSTATHIVIHNWS